MSATGIGGVNGVLGALVFVLAAASPTISAQETFPSRPVEIIVPTTAGGSIDLIVRMLAETVEPVLGQKVVVINKPGAAEFRELIESDFRAMGEVVTSLGMATKP